jgi:predicted transcriptional regulator
MMSTSEVLMLSNGSNERPRLGAVSARLDPAIIEIVERVAEAERRPVSSLVRNIVSDWARQQQEHAAGA